MPTTREPTRRGVMLAAAVVLGAADATPAAGVADADGDGGGREEGCSTGMTLCAAPLSKTSQSRRGSQPALVKNRPGIPSVYPPPPVFNYTKPVFDTGPVLKYRGGKAHELPKQAMKYIFTRGDSRISKNSPNLHRSLNCK